MENKKNRKKRSDRKHVIYKIVCLKTNDFYIGMTQCIDGDPIKGINFRLKQHFSKTRAGLVYKLHNAIRQWGEAAFTIEMVKTVIGKAQCHEEEVLLINSLKPPLNEAYNKKEEILTSLMHFAQLNICE